MKSINVESYGHKMLKLDEIRSGDVEITLVRWKKGTTGTPHSADDFETITIPRSQREAVSEFIKPV